MKGPPYPTIHLGARRPAVVLQTVRTHVLMRCMDVQHTKHATYILPYHFVCIPKHHQCMLTKEIAHARKETARATVSTPSKPVITMREKYDRLGRIFGNK